MTVDKTQMALENEKCEQLDYRNKVILAPMVRVGTLPMRVLALEYGADIVYTEEIIDIRLIKSRRRKNAALNTIDYVDLSDGTIVFRTCDLEKKQLVLQLGTSDAERALAVGKMIENDISGLDINMGCPKEFSIKGGMGIALLEKPDKAAHILKTLCENLKIPVTCKIRILPGLNETIKLVQKLAATGISAIGIHARTKDERPNNKPHPDFIREIAKCVNIPVIANGGSKEIVKYNDIFEFKNLCGADSIMIARAAQDNISIFRKDGLLPIDDVIYKYLKLCIDYDNAPHKSKYCVQGILKELQETPRGKLFLQSQTLEQICDVWNLGDYCRAKQMEFQQNGNYSRYDVIPGYLPEDNNDTAATDEVTSKGPIEKRRKTLDSDIIEENIAFIRANYINDPTLLPKSVLYTYAIKNCKQKPSYEIQAIDKLFRAICMFDGKRYTSSFLEKNKRQAEQAAAIVCLHQIGMISDQLLIYNGSLKR